MSQVVARAMATAAITNAASDAPPTTAMALTGGGGISPRSGVEVVEIATGAVTVGSRFIVGISPPNRAGKNIKRAPKVSSLKGKGSMNIRLCQ
jgi:hypothetical protein